MKCAHLRWRDLDDQNCRKELKPLNMSTYDQERVPGWNIKHS